MDATLITNRITTKACVAVLIALTVSFSAHAQTSSKRKRTVWVSPPTGSLLGGGFADADDSDAPSSSRANIVEENVTLRKALTGFDAQSRTVVGGWVLAPSAVAWQTGVSAEVLKRQQAKTGMTYGDLLVANSLARGSGKSFDEIISLRAKSQSWSQLTKRLNVNIDSIATRLQRASDSIKFSQGRKNKWRQQNLRDVFNPVEHAPPPK